MLQDGVRPGSGQPVVKQRQGDVELAGAACGVLAKHSRHVESCKTRAAASGGAALEWYCSGMLNGSHAPGTLDVPPKKTA